MLVAERSFRERRPRAPALAAALACALAPAAAAGTQLADDELWKWLRAGGLVLLIRHASAPGAFDPPGFRLDDCATQRNLSDDGRAQARRLGEAVRARGVEVARVRSSRWCRARDTATLAFARQEPWPDLDSIVGEDGAEIARRVARLREAIAAWSGPGTFVLVTHQYVITELAGRPTGEGEMIVVAPRPGGFDVLGALAPAP
jgi:broad specificity phosphatase PhoE